MDLSMFPPFPLDTRSIIQISLSLSLYIHHFLSFFLPEGPKRAKQYSLELGPSPLLSLTASSV